MLGSDRFSFETPNVIDPGDLPPSTPKRVNAEQPISPQSNTLSTHSIDDELEESSDDEEDDYETQHRLLQDIGDLDLSPRGTRNKNKEYPHQQPRPRPYDPYDDEEEDEEQQRRLRGDNNHHSLPSVEDARLYAASLLAGRNGSNNSTASSAAGSGNASGRGGPFSRTVRLDGANGASLPTSKHLLWRTFCRCSRKELAAVFAVVFLLSLSIGIGVAVSNKNSSAVQQVGSSSFNPWHPAAPSKAQTRQQDIIDFLTANQITWPDMLDDPDSPQSKAVQWMASTDALQREVPLLLHSKQRFVQRYVLAVLFYAWDGLNWKENYEWMSPVDECAWFVSKSQATQVSPQDRDDDDGVPSFFEVANVSSSSSSIHLSVGVTCNSNLGVQGIYLPSNGLKGSIPNELQFLTDLELLAVPYNHIGGRFPTSMSKLSKLNYLDLRYNAMAGVLPDWMGDMNRLEVLGLANNALAGSVPPSFGTLGRLKTLSLSDNAFTGSIHFVQYLSLLEYLWVDRNLFTGVVNDLFLVNPRLVQVDLSFNKLKGDPSFVPSVFPLHLLQHPSLQVLNMDDNDLNVQLPALTQVNNALQFLSLRKAMVDGPIPSTISNLQVLEHLDLTDNAITGTVPYELGNMVSLTYLAMGNNAFAAIQDFPPYLSRLVNLRELNLESTQMGGNLPNWIGTNLKKLKMIDLSHNYLAGTVPQAVWELPNLQYFIMHDNQLQGSIPQDMQVSTDLKVFSIYHNNALTGDASLFCPSDDDQKPDLIAIDCSVSCQKSCCAGVCCDSANNAGDDGNDKEGCYAGKVATYLSWYADQWEFNYTRADYAFDPANLIEAGVATVEEGDYIKTSNP